MNSCKKLVFLSLTFLIFRSAGAQTNLYSVGINFGAFIYNGDLSPWRMGSLKTPAFVLGFTGHRDVSSTLAARLELNFGSLRGDEAKYYTPEFRRYRAFAFKTRITELVLAAEWSPLGREHKLSPYLFGGVGVAATKIIRDYSRFSYEYFDLNDPTLAPRLQLDIDHPLPRTVAIFPVGFGLKYGISDKVSLHGEAAQRFTFNDYIDGFSQAGNPKLRDNYTKYSVGLRLALGNDDPYACPTIHY